MKVGILTQPLEENYGGILQAFALQKTLGDIGVSSEIINRVENDAYDRPLGIRIMHLLGRLYRLKDHGNIRKVGRPYYIEQRKREVLYQHTYRFIRQYLSTSPRLNTDEKFYDYVSSHEYDGFIVGSDQCWRPKYSPNIYHYYLDFCASNEHLIRLAYAASFGVDEWEYTEQETEICRRLAEKFDAISVREDSGVRLCTDFLDYPSAKTVLDPTLLMSSEDYISLLNVTSFPHSPGDMMVYILDRSIENTDFVAKVADASGLTPFSVIAQHSYQDEACYPIKSCIQPPVENWIRGFCDAQMVVADSFHGCVFSIIFNKPFIAIANPERGLARVESLLRTFHLSERLVTDINSFDCTVLSRPIEWSHVNEIVQIKKAESLQFLRQGLRLE